MKPGTQPVAGSTPPAAPLSGSPLAAPEFATLRDVRRALGRGGLPSRRTPQQNARLAAFRTVDELLRLLEEYGSRVESGTRCRLVEQEHAREPGRLLLELRIEVDP